MKKFSLTTGTSQEFVDITDKIRSFLEKTDSPTAKKGVCHIYVPHTTAAVTINESADPAVSTDIVSHLRELVPSGADYSHVEGNGDAHIKSSIIGNSTKVFVEGGNLLLGTWQGIHFCEFDGPRSREFWVQLT